VKNQNWVFKKMAYLVNNSKIMAKFFLSFHFLEGSTNDFGFVWESTVRVIT